MITYARDIFQRVMLMITLVLIELCARVKLRKAAGDVTF